MKKALVVGIDDYPNGNELYGCVNDAAQVASAIERNGDGSPNFEIRFLTSSREPVTAGRLHEAMTELLSAGAVS